MAVEIKVPELGESVIEATVARWMKQEGDPIAAGEPVVELETDKINVEVGAQQAGVLEKILRRPGETVLVGEVLATVAAEGAAAPEQTSAAPEQTSAAHPTAAPSPAKATERQSGYAKEATSAAATPVAQRLAHDLGVDLGQVKPTGPGGRITKEDVQGFASRSAAGAAQPASPPPPAAASPAGGREERVRMSRRRQTIARRLVEAQHTAAMLTTFNEIDMSAVMELRKRRREAFKLRHGVDLGFMSFFVKATVAALKAFPNLNAEIQGEEIVRKHYYDIGVAIGADEGLVVPVVRGADQLHFAGIEAAIREYTAKVKSGTLALEDLRGGTFTITNGGVFGSLMSTPILNPPQVGILGMHAIKERPVAVGGEIVLRPMMYVALSYDHRIVDGREAVQFVAKVKDLIEDPGLLLLE
jgi:2-oxoglutarate dehydrogenase E2 component (dihydrolipoamide succinyltransferase)